MNKSQVYRIAVVSAALAVIAWIWVISPRPAATGQRLPAPPLALPMQANGPPVPISTLKGKVVLLDFWATWCGPCRLSIPDIEALYKKYKGQGLEVVGISRDHAESRAQIPAAAKALGMTYPTVVADDIPDINAQYGVDSLPTVILIDRKGNIAEVQDGYHPPAELDAKIAALLRETP